MRQVDLYEVACKCADTLRVNARKHDVSFALQGERGDDPGPTREMVIELVNNLVRQCSSATTKRTAGWP